MNLISLNFPRGGRVVPQSFWIRAFTTVLVYFLFIFFWGGHFFLYLYASDCLNIKYTTYHECYLYSRVLGYKHFNIMLFKKFFSFLMFIDIHMYMYTCRYSKYMRMRRIYNVSCMAALSCIRNVFIKF